MRIAGDIVRGFLLASPVLVGAGLMIRSHLGLREENVRLDAARVSALNHNRRLGIELELSRQKILSLTSAVDSVRVRDAAFVSETQSAAFARQQKVIDFLKQEIESLEQALKKDGDQADHVVTLNRQVADLRRELEAERADRSPTDTLQLPSSKVSESAGTSPPPR